MRIVCLSADLPNVKAGFVIARLFHRAGFSLNWHLHHGYVTTYSGTARYAKVSRIILGIARPGFRKVRVSHDNGDLTDLRRRNLVTNEVKEAKPRYGRDDRRPNAPAGAGWRR